LPNATRGGPRRYLITTADERSWKTDEPVLFLGEWCKLYARRHLWETLDSETVQYHWKDRDMVYRDYLYLRECHERLLPKLAAFLNAKHGTNASLRYWRLLAGPWLSYFTHVVYDRWSSIQRATHEYELSGTTVFKYDSKEMVPNDMGEFYSFMPTDAWNHHIYGSILQDFTSVPIVEGNPSPDLRKPGPSPGAHKAGLKAAYKSAAARFVRRRDTLFIATYLRNPDLFKLYLRFGQVPQFLSMVTPRQTAVDWAQREWVLDQGRNEFENCLLRLIPKQIPTALLEGYGRLVDQARRLPWPCEPRAVFTSNSLWFDTVSLAYIAEQTERGVPLISGQHGGVYGISKFAFGEEHEIAVSDKFMTWGWDVPGDMKLVPVGMLKLPYRRREPQNNGKLLLIGMSTFSRYSYLMTSESSIDFDAYMQNCFKLVGLLPSAAREDLLVRLTARDVGWSQSDRWRDRFPDVELDVGEATMLGLMRMARLVVCTYNSTNFLEAVASDTPTILFCDFTETPLRDSAAPFFEDLIRVGVVHESPESAARHIDEVWADVENWWRRPDVREALTRFRDRFCRTRGNVLRNVERVIRCEIAESERRGA
jgi:putative transferase (TIGR04331 family)